MTAPVLFANDVFISYTHADIEEAVALEARLKAAGVSVWRDERLAESPSDNFIVEINDALTTAAKVVVLWSQVSIGKPWVLGEAERARRLGKSINIAVDPLAGLLPMIPAPFSGHLTHPIADIPAILAAVGAAPIDGHPGLYALPPRLDLHHLPDTFASHLYGRAKEQQALLDAWDARQVAIMALDAMGGAGKTALARHFVDDLARSSWRGAQAVFAWSFYSQGSNEDRQVGADEFFDEALAFFGYGRRAILSELAPAQQLTPGEMRERQRVEIRKLSAHDKGVTLADLIKERRVLLILDGLEPLQYAAGAAGGAVGERYGREGGLKEQGIKALIEALVHGSRAFCLITTRLRIGEIKKPLEQKKPTVRRLPVLPVPTLDAIDLLRAPRERGDDLPPSSVAPHLPTARYKLPARAAFPDEAIATLPDKQLPADYNPREGDDRTPMDWRDARDLIAITQSLKGHALALNHVANFLVIHHKGDARRFDRVPETVELGDEIDRSTFRVMRATEMALADRIRQMGHAETPAAVIAGRELGLLFFLGFFDRPIDVAFLKEVFPKTGALAPEPADVALAATDLSAIEDDPALDWEAREARQKQRERRWDEVKPVWEARHRVLVRRLFAGMATVTDEQIIEALGRLANLGLITRRELPRDGLEIDCHPLVREYFGSRLGGDAKGEGALDLPTSQAGHGRLYDWYRFDGLPKAFREPVGYGVLALGSAFPDAPFKKDVIKLADGTLPKVAVPTWPPTVRNATPDQLRAAARLIDGPQWQEALATFRPEGEAGMTPLFSAIAHGCKAGRQAEAWAEVYRPRITRGNEDFASKKLGLYGQELAALAAFFDEAFTTPSERLTPSDRALALGNAAFRLSALGRLEDAVAPFEKAVQAYDTLGNATAAAITAGNLTELLLTLGRVDEAVTAGGQAQTYADRSGDAEERMEKRTTYGVPMLAAGDIATAEALFRAAEVLQKARQPDLPRLYSVAGFQYADLALARGRAAEAGERAAYAFRTVMNGSKTPLDIALATLTQARAALAAAGEVAARAGSVCLPANGSTPHPAESETPQDRFPPGTASKEGGGLGEAMPPSRLSAASRAASTAALTAAALAALRRANQEQYLPSGLLAHAEALWRADKLDDAGRHLREVDTIATRGPMPLFAAEAALLRARMQLAAGRRGRATTYRNEAAALIGKHGWARALPELAVLDAEIALAESAPDAADKLAAAVTAVRGSPPRPVGGTGVPEVDDAGLMIDGGWWGLLPRLSPLLAEDDPRRAELLAAQAAYNAERDQRLAKERADLDAKRAAKRAAEWTAEDAALADPAFRAELSAALVSAGYKPLDETPISEQRNDARTYRKMKSEAEAKARGHIQPDDVSDSDVDAALADPQMRGVMTAFLKHNEIDQPLDGLPREAIKAIIADLHNMAKDREQVSNGSSDEADPDIPDGFVRQVFADPEADALLRDVMAQNNLQGDPADLPFKIQKAIVAALVRGGAISFDAAPDPSPPPPTAKPEPSAPVAPAPAPPPPAAPVPEPPRLTSWLDRLNPFSRKH